MFKKEVYIERRNRLKNKLKANKKEAVEIEGDYEEKCPHCDYVAKGLSIGMAKAKLRGHMISAHREAKEKRGVGRPKKK